MDLRANSCDMRWLRMLSGAASVEPVGCLVRRHGQFAVRTERDTDKATARCYQFRLAVEIREPVQAAATRERIDDVQDAFVRRECQPLRPAEGGEQRANAAVAIDAIDVIV